MKSNTSKILDELIVRFPCLEREANAISGAFDILFECYKHGGKVLVCGNGGSAADSEHIVGELMKGFLKKREIPQEEKATLASKFDNGEAMANALQGALSAISLVSHSALSTAFLNDVDPNMVFAQQVYGYAKEGDVLIAMSTSGNSENIINAVKIAEFKGIKAIGIAGDTGGKLKKYCTSTICVPEIETFKIQELHLPVYHALCAMIEEEIF